MRQSGEREACRSGKLEDLLHRGRLAFFSWVRISNSLRKASRALDREGTRILSLHSLTQAHRDTRSTSEIMVSRASTVEGEVEDETHDLR